MSSDSAMSLFTNFPLLLRRNAHTSSIDDALYIQVLAANQDEINSLFSKRREMELDYMEQKQKKQQEYMDEISKMRVRDSEEYHKLKIKLETDIQTLEPVSYTHLTLPTKRIV